MFKQAIKYTIAAVIWRRYRNIIAATVLLFGYFWVIGMLHNDYLAYTEVKNTPTYIGTSFFAKWVAYGLGLGLYLLYLNRWQRPDPEKNSRPGDAHGKKAGKKTSSNRGGPVSESESELTDGERDVFATLRNKPSLRSKSDVVIDRYPRRK